jgi:hypothetical protein
VFYDLGFRAEARDFGEKAGKSSLYIEGKAIPYEWVGGASWHERVSCLGVVN